LKKRAVVIDSLVDLPPYFKPTLPVEVVGFRVYIDDVEYIDGKTISKEEFYEKAMRSDNLRTSFLPPQETKALYEKLKKEGYEEILALHLPARVSGFLSSVENVVRDIGMKVKVIDTRSLSIGAGMVAYKLIEMFEKGMELEEIEKAFWKIRKSTFLQYSVSSLKFLIKNGRIGKAKGFAAVLLNILPILTVDEDGEIAPICKVRGGKKVIEKMVENILKFTKESEKIEVVFAWGAEHTKKHTTKLKELLFKKLGDRIEKHGEVRISSTVSCHTGPEVFGVVVYAE